MQFRIPLAGGCRLPLREKFVSARLRLRWSDLEASMRALVDQGVVVSFRLGFARESRISVEVEANAGLPRESLEAEVLRAIARAFRVAELSRNVLAVSCHPFTEATTASEPEEPFIDRLWALMQADENDEAVDG